MFGSWARGTQHGGSDLDVAIDGDPSGWNALELGHLIGRLEAAAGRPVDLVLLDEAPPGLAFRIFRDGKVLVQRDAAALAARKARAALDYFDWQPVEALFSAATVAPPTNGDSRQYRKAAGHAPRVSADLFSWKSPAG